MIYSSQKFLETHYIYLTQAWFAYDQKELIFLVAFHVKKLNKLALLELGQQHKCLTSCS